MDIKKQRAFDAANGLQELRYTQDIRQGVRQVYNDPADELAMLRKEVVMLRSILIEKLGVVLDDAEFMEYNTKIEQIKAEAKR